MERKYKKLSKGEKLKFAFAFALAHHPKLLLLDEPGRILIRPSVKNSIIF